MKERYQGIDDKSEDLRDYLATYREKGQEFLERYEMSWIYHDSALEGIVYSPTELNAALRGEVSKPAEASLMPLILEIRNHKAAVDYVREEARTSGKKVAQITLTQIKRIHDLLSGNTPEAQAARALTERREKTERELAKEKEKSGYRKDMPLHRTYFHEIAQPAKIQPLLEKLVDYMASAEFRELHPIEQSANVQHQFLHIFPFTEHSGKVGRMCSNLVLLRHHYLPCVIHSIDRQRYYEALRGSSIAFRLLMVEAMENSLDNALKYFRDQSRRYRAIN
ncbi:MAG TPA: Fic family protein [Myxococcaceae bacterium]|nr:Fic family protein [Myxococcaceae bacterium]